MADWKPPKCFFGGFSTPGRATLAFRASGGDAPQVSVDGGRTWGTLETLRVDGRKATSADVTHVRWDVANPRAARGRGVLTYSAVVR